MIATEVVADACVAFPRVESVEVAIVLPTSLLSDQDRLNLAHRRRTAVHSHKARYYHAKKGTLCDLLRDVQSFAKSILPPSTGLYDRSS